MNKEVMKVMNKKSFASVEAAKKWWRKNWYKVMRVIIFPVWAIAWCYDRLKTRAYNRTEWDENRADTILNYYIPRKSEWNGEKNSFYYCKNGFVWSWSFARGYVKLKDKTFWKKYRDNIRDYLINTFELDGFDKKVGSCEDGWTEITFKMK